MLQYVPLNIMTVGDQTSKYDLPISSAFALFTAPVQDAPIAKGDKAIFRLKKDVYNTITSNNLPTSVMCKYNPAGRFSQQHDIQSFRSGEKLSP